MKIAKEKSQQIYLKKRIVSMTNCQFCGSGYVVNPVIKYKTILGYNRKGRITKESVNRYRIIVKYVEVTENERKIKRAIIEDVLKN